MTKYLYCVSVVSPNGAKLLGIFAKKESAENMKERLEKDMGIFNYVEIAKVETDLDS